MVFLKRNYVFLSNDELSLYGIDPRLCSLVYEVQRPGGRLVKKTVHYSLKTCNYCGFPRGYMGINAPPGLDIESNLLDCTSPGLPFTRKDIKFSGFLLKRLQQDVAVRKCFELLKNSAIHSTSLSLPCGWGKTACALAVASLLGRRTFVLVHTRVLAHQWRDRIEKFVPGARVKVMDGSTDLNFETFDFGIGLMQSLAKVDKKVQMSNTFSSFGLLIVDEAHHAPCASIRSSMLCFGCKYTLALSATPYRQDGLTQYIEWAFGPPALVVPPRFERCELHKVEFVKKQKISAEDVMVAGYGGCTLVDTLASCTERNVFIRQLAVDAAKKHGRGVLVVTSRRVHAELLYELVKEYMGDKTGLIMGGVELGITTSSPEECNFPHVIVSTTQLVCEGFDRGTSLNCLILALPRGHSENSTWLCQTVGRVSRTAAEAEKGNDNKVSSYIYDVVDKKISHCKNTFKERMIAYRKFALVCGNQQ